MLVFSNQTRLSVGFSLGVGFGGNRACLMVETTNTTRKRHKSLKHLVLTEVLLCFFNWNQEIQKISEVLAEATLPMGGPAAGFGANSKKHFTTSSASARAHWSRLDTLMATRSKGVLWV